MAEVLGDADVLEEGGGGFTASAEGAAGEDDDKHEATKGRRTTKKICFHVRFSVGVGWVVLM